MQDIILLIVPDVLLRRNLVDFLANNGYVCRAVECLRTGLDELREHPYRLAILDLDLSNGDGATLTRRLRAARPSVRIIALDSAAEHELYDEDALLYDAIIPKPFVDETLLATLNKLSPIADITPLIPEP